MKKTAANTINDDKYFFVLPSFGLKYGGLTNVVLKKTKLLSESVGYNCSILTLSHSKNFQIIRKAQKESGKLGNNVELLNIFDYYAGDGGLIYKKNKNNKFKSNKKSFEYVKKLKIYRIYEGGILKESWKYDKNCDKLRYIKYFDHNRKMYKRDIYNDFGYLSKSVYINTESDNITTELYYRPNGKVFLSYWYDENKVVKKIVWFSKRGQVKKTFNSETDFQKHYLNTFISADNNSFFVSEKRFYDNAVIGMRGDDNIYKVMSHHGHYSKTPDSFANIKEVDASVVLTNAHKKDVDREYPKNKNRLHVIANAYDTPLDTPAFKKRDNKRVIATSKYTERKQIDHMIKAFHMVVKQMPDAKLDLYGYGSEESNLKALISELDLTKNVYIRGFSDDLRKEYSNAVLSLQTSTTEGFSISMLESLALGCPVISYDIKYGPSDMITNGENGFLVENDSIDGLAECIVKSLSDENLLKKMSENAYEDAKKFNYEEWVKNWVNLFESIKR